MTITNPIHAKNSANLFYLILSCPKIYLLSAYSIAILMFIL